MRHPALIALLCLWLAGCVAIRPPVAPADPALFADALFGAPELPAQATDIFAFSPAMQQHLARHIAPRVRNAGASAALVEALYDKARLQLHYEPEVTRNARETFEARSGNCLSLVIMTAAFARQLDIPVHFRRVLADSTVVRRGGLQLESGHVNLSLGRAISDWRRGSDDNSAIVVDFLPAAQVRGYRHEEIDDTTLLAMYLTNRAAEALAQGAVAPAYAWSREAVRQAPGFAGGYNTLALAYWRQGHLALAERALSQGLGRQGDAVPLLANLVALHKAQGQGDRAEAVAKRLARLEPYPPLHFLDLGLAALQRGDAQAASQWFSRELARTEELPELHYWMAVAQGRLGHLAQAQWHLRAAAQSSHSDDERARYGGKLQRLKAQGSARTL